jgi:epoxyqueuosine reductase
MPDNRGTTNTAILKIAARELGFFYCGISKAEYLKDEARKMEQWLAQNKHGQMGYLARNFEKRMDPRLLVPGAKTVVSLLYNYYPKVNLESRDSYKVSKYAYGEDYHFVIKRKLKQLMQILAEKIGEIDGRVFVDSAPVMERSWAQKSGAGWIGKNSLLLNKRQGSFFFLAELISDLELVEDGPVVDHCGTCTRCIDACPTDAIDKPYSVDASKCISYFTIELKEAIPPEVKGKFQDWAFGCDICQDVCPWNQYSVAHNEPAFDPDTKLAGMDKGQWVDLTKAVFKDLFKKSAVKRTGFAGLKRNIAFLGESK